MDGIDGARLHRARIGLLRSDEALAWLRVNGLDAAFAESAGIGVEAEEEHGLQFVHVAMFADGRRRLATLRVDRAGDPVPSASGAPYAIWSSPRTSARDVLVVPDLAAFWRLERIAGEAGLEPLVVTAPAPQGIPVEWRHSGHWAAFDRVTLMTDDPADALLVALAPVIRDGLFLALPPAGMTWFDALSSGVTDGLSAVASGIEHAVPAVRLPVREGVRHRIDARTVDVHALDEAGRSMRLVRVEEEYAAPSNRGGASRMRDVVVRSDGAMLDVEDLPCPPGTPPGDRLVALSDGSRLSHRPTAAAASRWSYSSALAFVYSHASGAEPEGVNALWQAVAALIERAVGMEEAITAKATAFVMMSYVYQGFDELRAPVFWGGTMVQRMRLIATLARLCHGGMVRGRSRASVLAHAADEVGGTIVLDEPGALAGPGGGSEIGRFLVASSVSGTVWDHVGGSGRRGLRVFGPRAVVASRRPGAVTGVEILAEIGGSERAEPLDEGAATEMVDRLYTWSAAVLPRLDGWPEGDRAGAIAAILEFSGGLITEQEGAAAREDQRGPRADEIPDAADVMTAALAACVADGRKTVSITQLILEAAIRGAAGDAYSPERIGRWLTGTGALRAEAPPTRRRLHGHISRIYELEPAAIVGSRVGEDGREADPFDFCLPIRCDGCRYAAVCPGLFPEMMARKNGA